MKILVCGGRDFADFVSLVRMMDELKPTFIIQGGASGADSLAVDYAECLGIPYKTYPAQWSTHGPAAGPIRNQEMIDDGKPDVVVAFPGGRGTADMVRRAKKAGLNVIEVGASQ